MDMDQLVALCKRRGFLFQSSEIYGGLQGFWDYGPLGVELKRNVREAWWRDMVTAHNELEVPPGAPSTYEMVGLDCAIIMHPQVWKCSGHYDLFHDLTVDCRESQEPLPVRPGVRPLGDGQRATHLHRQRRGREEGLELTQHKAMKFFNLRGKDADESGVGRGRCVTLMSIGPAEFPHVLGPDAKTLGTLTEPREFNLMFETHTGAVRDESSKTFLRPETAQGIFVNFKNVCDSTRVRVPFGIAQIGKSFRNEITPRNFTFRSREFEQMEIEFFCHPSTSPQWYRYWRDLRYQWYLSLGLAGEPLAAPRS